MKVAADHDDAVADAAFDGQRAEDDDRGVGHLFVALDADVLPDGDAGAGQFVSGDVRGGFRGLSEHGNGSDETGQNQCQQRSAHRYPTLPSTDECRRSYVPLSWGQAAKISGSLSFRGLTPT